MVALEQAGNSKVHFLVPAPPGLNPESPEMFGFFTYELRVGHADALHGGIWSTAQGRFGRPLRATGVQHPAPALFCTCKRTQDELIVEAPYAVAVQNGLNITADPPRTEIWALLYARVRQADGKDFRNILLEDRKLALIPRLRDQLSDPFGETLVGFENRDAPARGWTYWTQYQIALLLGDLGLPADAPLSVLCVEMMPRVRAVRAQDSLLRVPDQGDLTAQVLARSTFGPGGGAPAAVQDEVRPLSDGLGNFRILRTSPLTAVPDVCT
jgi:hypothetical protein